MIQLMFWALELARTVWRMLRYRRTIGLHRMGSAPQMDLFDSFARLHVHIRGDDSRIHQGALVSKVDGQPVTRNTGDIYTCKIGQVIENENKGNTVAIMPVFHLLQA